MRMASYDVKYVVFLLVAIKMVMASETNPEDNVLFGDRNGLILLSPNTSQVTRIKSNPLIGMKAIFLDYHAQTNTVYFSNQNNHRISISKIHLDGSDQAEILIPLDDDTAAEGVAVDWIAQNLYWVTPREHKISVSRLNGSSPMDVVTGLGDPRDVCLDPANGYLYWSDWGEQPAIERSFLDGTGREAIVTDDLGYPNGIAIDLVEEKLYWGDAYYDRIEVCDLDGSNRKALISKNLGHVFGLTVLGDTIYWSDWWTRRIEKANKRTGEDREVIYGTGQRVMGLKAININKIPEGSNTCANNNGECSHMCLYRPPPLTHACACPDGMELDSKTGGSSGVCRQTSRTDTTTPTFTVTTTGNLDEMTTVPSPTVNEKLEVTDERLSTTDGGSVTTAASVSTSDAEVDTTESTHSSILTIPTTEASPESTEEPLVSPCALPRTSDFAMDQFCLEETTVAFTAMVLGRFNSAGFLQVFLGRKDPFFAKSGADKAMRVLVTRMKEASTQSCNNEIEQGKEYLFMGKFEEWGKSMTILASYVMPAESPEYDKAVRNLQRDNACVVHNWSKLQGQWANLGG